jgi:hypothetical protein
LPDATPADTGSAAYVASIKEQVHAYYGSATVNTTSYSPPVYTASADQPTQTVAVWDCQHKGYLDSGLAAAFAQVPLPPQARPAQGTDAELVLWQPATDTVWEFWRLQRNGSGWAACWGGRIQRASTSAGVFAAPYGTAATGLSLLGGLMRIDELQRGEIDHVIEVALVRTRAGVFSWPANRTDGWVHDPNEVPEGMRFRLDPAVNVDALPMSAAGKTIAKAIQSYGMIVRDKAGSVAFYAENPQPAIDAGGTNPYAAIFGGRQAYQVMDGFPWDHLEALPFDYGKGIQPTAAPASDSSIPKR